MRRADQCKGHDSLGESTPGPWHRAAADIFNRQPATADQRPAHSHRPKHQIESEEHHHPPRQVPCPAFESGQAGRKLPAGEPLAEDEFEERS